MTTHPVCDPNTPIGEVLKAAGSEGIVLESEGQGSYALLPLDDDVIDLLIERSPQIPCRMSRDPRAKMNSGQFQTHEDVRRQLIGE